MSEVKNALRKLREKKAARDVAAQQVNQSIEDCESALRKEGIRVYASVTLREHAAGKTVLAWSREGGSWQIVVASYDYSNPDTYMETFLGDAPLRDRAQAATLLPALIEELVLAVEDQARELLDASELVDAVTTTILGLDDDEAE